MKSRITKSLTVSLAIAAALAIPTAVKAQADTQMESSSAGMEEITTESNYCLRFAGIGWLCF